ncbi:MAG: alpha/beta hydrolase [Angelakisella sp.]|nr:alpha/beta hydrolase [Angelakisella sp.]
MNKEVFTYPSSNGRWQVSALIYTPDEGMVVRGVVQLSHGMSEYVKRYEPLARELCQAGLVFCGNDHLGHGATALLNREKLGYFGPHGARKFLVEDLELLRREVAGRYPGVPYFLLGHSMGSFIARLYARRFGGSLSGLILSGTAGRNLAAGAGKVLARGVALAKGDRYISDTVYDMANGSFRRAIPESKTPVDWLSKDPEVCAAYLRDPQCAFKFTVSAYYELFCMLEECNSGQWYHEMPKRLPVYIFSGGQDPVGAMGAGPREVYQNLVQSGSQDVKLKLYPQGRHEMFNEVEKEEVKQDLFHWLESQMERIAQGGLVEDDGSMHQPQ